MLVSQMAKEGADRHARVSDSEGKGSSDRSWTEVVLGHPRAPI